MANFLSPSTLFFIIVLFAQVIIHYSYVSPSFPTNARKRIDRRDNQFRSNRHHQFSEYTTSDKNEGGNDLLANEMVDAKFNLLRLKNPLQRRDAIKYLVSIPSFLTYSANAAIAIVDETQTQTQTQTYTTYDPSSANNPSPIGNTDQTNFKPTDEVRVAIPYATYRDHSNSLGIELGEARFRNSRRVFIKSVAPSSLAFQCNIKENFVIVSINDEPTEGMDRKGVQLIVQRKMKEQTDLQFVFRDPGAFQSQLQSMTEETVVSTQIAPDAVPKNDEHLSDHPNQQNVFTVEQLAKSPLRCVNRKASIDDLVEISYVGRVVETGEIFDGSTITINNKGVPGRGGDGSIYFVLGKQPSGQFPPGWDTGMEGMCVGELRRITVPPALAYGRDGLPRRRIPPNATLTYDVTLLSINGLAQSE